MYLSRKKWGWARQNYLAHLHFRIGKSRPMKRIRDGEEFSIEEGGEVLRLIDPLITGFHSRHGSDKAASSCS
jgi:hypothetical protein